MAQKRNSKQQKSEEKKLQKNKEKIQYEKAYAGLRLETPISLEAKENKTNIATIAKFVFSDNFKNTEQKNPAEINVDHITADTFNKIFYLQYVTIGFYLFGRQNGNNLIHKNYLIRRRFEREVDKVIFTKIRDEPSYRKIAQYFFEHDDSEFILPMITLAEFFKNHKITGGDQTTTDVYSALNKMLINEHILHPNLKLSNIGIYMTLLKGTKIDQKMYEPVTLKILDPRYMFSSTQIQKMKEDVNLSPENQRCVNWFSIMIDLPSNNKGVDQLRGILNKAYPEFAQHKKTVSFLNSFRNITDYIKLQHEISIGSGSSSVISGGSSGGSSGGISSSAGKIKLSKREVDSSSGVSSSNRGGSNSSSGGSSSSDGSSSITDDLAGYGNSGSVTDDYIAFEGFGNIDNNYDQISDDQGGNIQNSGSGGSSSSRNISSGSSSSGGIRPIHPLLKLPVELQGRIRPIHPLLKQPAKQEEYLPKKFFDVSIITPESPTSLNLMTPEESLIPLMTPYVGSYYSKPSMSFPISRQIPNDNENDDISLKIYNPKSFDESSVQEAAIQEEERLQEEIQQELRRLRKEELRRLRKEEPRRQKAQRQEAQRQEAQLQEAQLQEEAQRQEETQRKEETQLQEEIQQSLLQKEEQRKKEENEEKFLNLPNLDDELPSNYYYYPDDDDTTTTQSALTPIPTTNQRQQQLANEQPRLITSDTDDDSDYDSDYDSDDDSNEDDDDDDDEDDNSDTEKKKIVSKTTNVLDKAVINAVIKAKKADIVVLEAKRKFDEDNREAKEAADNYNRKETAYNEAISRHKKNRSDTDLYTALKNAEYELKAASEKKTDADQKKELATTNKKKANERKTKAHENKKIAKYAKRKATEAETEERKKTAQENKTKREAATARNLKRKKANEEDEEKKRKKDEKKEEKKEKTEKKKKREKREKREKKKNKNEQKQHTKYLHFRS